MESVATIGHETVLSLLPMDECIDLIASALEALERGSADMPLRFGYSLPLADGKTGILASMPSFLPFRMVSQFVNDGHGAARGAVRH